MKMQAIIVRNRRDQEDGGLPKVAFGSKDRMERDGTGRSMDVLVFGCES